VTEWVVRWQGREARVRGFGNPGEARRHAERHFLRVAERWEELRPEATPAHFRERLEALLEPEAAVLDEAAAVYEELARRESADPGCLARWRYRRPPSGEGFHVLNVATPRGVFCAFAQGKPSVMTTAFRPLPARRRGPVRMQQFRDEARRRVMREF